MRKLRFNKKVLLTVVAISVILASGAAAYVFRMPKLKPANKNTAQKAPSFTLELMSGNSYLANKPIMLHFSVKDKDGKVVKDFDTVHDKKMHLIVVRKDRTNFQHVHPTLDEATGMFMIEPFTFPTDGEFRVYADFTPANAPKDEMGEKMAYTPYQDVKAGEMSKYTPQDLGADKQSSSVDGYDTSFFFPPVEDGPGQPVTSFYAGDPSGVLISIDKDKKPVTNLQPYLGALGHMVVLGPDLEFIHAHPTAQDINKQGGLIIFGVTFPNSGKYKLYLQTQANDKVSTFDYTLTVLPRRELNSQPTDSMQGMNHGGH